MSNNFYKYCVVPMCTNTTIKTPDKVFIRMPRDVNTRKKWCHAMKRDELKNKPLKSVDSPRFVCEDHFNLEDDMENYMRFKMMGGNIYLKKNVIPHIFDCQKTKKTTSRETGKARARKQMIDELLKDNEPSTSSVIPMDVQTNIDIPAVPTEEVTPPQLDKAVQVEFSNIIRKKFRSKGTSTPVVVRKTTSCSPFKTPPKKQQRFTNEDVPSISDHADLENIQDPHDSDYVYEDSNTSDFECAEVDKHILSKQMQQGFVLLIERLPQLYLGIPKDMYHIIEILSQNVHTPVMNIMITLKKIRLDFSYALLGCHFGMSESSICRIFNNTLPKLSSMLNELIFWPSPEKIRTHLPIAFRARYKNVQSIIDCLEIQIQKPTNPIHQSLTWSEYKGCNTLKYLVSCTPDGLVNFISCGYGGRVTDSTIAEDSGYFKCIQKGAWVMADRGFKNISHVLEKQGSHLVRPPSVFKNVVCTKEEVKEAKRIAALRIHVERVISRIREFHLLKMHSTIDHNLISSVDHIIVIVCGLINLQKSLIKI